MKTNMLGVIGVLAVAAMPLAAAGAQAARPVDLSRAWAHERIVSVTRGLAQARGQGLELRSAEHRLQRAKELFAHGDFQGAERAAMDAERRLAKSTEVRQ